MKQCFNSKQIMNKSDWQKFKDQAHSNYVVYGMDLPTAYLEAAISILHQKQLLKEEIYCVVKKT